MYVIELIRSGVVISFHDYNRREIPTPLFESQSIEHVFSVSVITVSSLSLGLGQTTMGRKSRQSVGMSPFP